MHSLTRLSLVILFLLLIQSCGKPEPTSLEATGSSILYSSEDRAKLFTTALAANKAAYDASAVADSFRILYQEEAANRKSRCDPLEALLDRLSDEEIQNLAEKLEQLVHEEPPLNH
jgi:hypothetical protein